MITYIVVDTGYLVELFEVPDHCNQTDVIKIKDKFKIAKEQKYRLYIPIPVLFELANFIAHVKDGNIRRQLVSNFSETVKQGISSESTFLNIIPCTPFAIIDELKNSLEDFVQRFADEYSQQGLGFTDSAVLIEAQNLKNKYNLVHIWTKDEPLKPYEPDTEPNPFIGTRK
ncbi:hypothetical protein DOJK_01288 [Patescibacteria group bacterium]|nr:hypothetical protein DOJK_01288 [Patescibacteria group bacterium]